MNELLDEKAFLIEQIEYMTAALNQYKIELELINKQINNQVSLENQKPQDQ